MTTTSLQMPYTATIYALGIRRYKIADRRGRVGPGPKNLGFAALLHVLLVDIDLVQGSQGEGDCLAADKAVRWLSCVRNALLSILSFVPHLAEPSPLRGEAPSHSSLFARRESPKRIRSVGSLQFTSYLAIPRFSLVTAALTDASKAPHSSEKPHFPLT